VEGATHGDAGGEVDSLAATARANTPQDAPGCGFEADGHGCPPAEPVPTARLSAQVAGALSVVVPRARRCLYGGSDPVHAEIVFGNDGRVAEVVIRDAPASSPLSTCVRDALRFARVPAFSGPSYRTGVVVRP
jgi:hypothetical protein